jgi:hypothetical protein
MKKTWLILMITCGVLGWTLPLAPAAELEFSSDYRIRGFSTQNLTDADDDTEDDTAYYSSRFLLSAKARHENFQGVVTAILGHDSNTGNRLLGNDPYGPTDGGDTHFFGLLEGYLKADFEAGSFAAGRQLLILGHSLIYDDPVDGLRLLYDVGPVTATAAAAKVFENTASAPAGGAAIGNSPDPSVGTTEDADLYLLNLSGQLSDNIGLQIFMTHLNDRGPNLLINHPSDTQLELTTVGFTADALLGPIRYAGEIDILSGSISNQAGVEPDLRGLNIVMEFSTLTGPFEVGLTGIYASGQDPDEDPSTGGDLNVNGINGNYPTGIILTNGGARSLAPKDGTCLSINGASLGGVPNCIGGSGLTAAKLSGSSTIMKKVTLEAAAIWAQATEDNSAGENSIGWELDGTAKYLFQENFHLLGGIGYLIAGDFFGSDPDNLMVLVAELAFKFE